MKIDNGQQKEKKDRRELYFNIIDFPFAAIFCILNVFFAKKLPEESVHKSYL